MNTGPSWISTIVLVLNLREMLDQRMTGRLHIATSDVEAPFVWETINLSYC